MKVETRFPKEKLRYERLVENTPFYRGGMAGTSSCPRRGFMWLTDQRKRRHVVETACKTWGCLGCRDRVLGRVIQILKTGLSTSEVSWLITCTFRLGSNGVMHAGGVRKAWVSFLQSMKRDQELKTVEWFKVTELTKRKQAHLHWVSLGPTGMMGRCRSKMGRPSRGKPCLATPECLEHRLRRYWVAATGDSYIVDVRRVFSVGGACTYLAKYFFKTVAQRKEIEELGFLRRYDTSRGWPRETKVSLRGTIEGWEETGWFRNPSIGALAFSRQSARAPELDLVGTDQAMLRVARAKAKKVVKLGKVLTHASIW